MGSEVPRDRSLISLLEIAAAGLLIAAFFLPWYQLGGQDVEGIAQYGITMDVLLPWFLIPLGAAAAVVTTLVGLVLPGRGVVVAILVAFGAAGMGAALRLLDVATGDWSMQLEPPTPGRGLWLFAAGALLGVALATIDLFRGGSSTFGWRALGKPSARGVGSFLAWIGALVIALAIGLFPMFPRWWLVGFVIVLVAPLGWRARRAR